jgi:hypothetical protein
VTAADGHPKVISLAMESWKLAFEVAQRMPLVIGIGFVLALAINLGVLPLLPSLEEEVTFGNQLLEFASQVAQSFVLTPVAIAVHRFVLLGEVTPRYALNPFAPRFLLFFMWTVIFVLLVMIPILPAVIVGQTEEFDAQFFASLGLLILAMLLALRLMLLFPAIAVDAGGATWRNAYLDSRGQVMRIIGAALVAGIPFLIVFVSAFALLDWPGKGNVVSGTAFSVIYSAGVVFSVCVYASLASKLYAALAQTLK